MTQGITLAPRAVAQNEAYKRQAMLAVHNGFKSADQAYRDYMDNLAGLLREARQEVDDDRTINTKCTECGRIHTMGSHVGHYRCDCNPHVDRFPFNERYIVEAEET